MIMASIWQLVKSLTFPSLLLATFCIFQTKSEELHSSFVNKNGLNGEDELWFGDDHDVHSRVRRADLSAIKDKYDADRLKLFSSSDKEEIVAKHNEYRKAAGASNMEYMIWDDDLENTAGLWASVCFWGHGHTNVETQYNSVGQNMWLGQGRPNGKGAVRAWHDNEIYNYKYDEAKCKSGKVCGHYTQVVWAKSNRVGCGRAYCAATIRNTGEPDGRTSVWILVCDYAPAGNYRGVRPFRKGPPCTECTSGKAECYDNYACRPCSEHNEKCDCRQECHNCGTVTAECRCECKAGWHGQSCDTACEDTDDRCGKSPGWPSPVYCSAHEAIPKNCPLMCSVCEPSSGPQDGKCVTDSPATASPITTAPKPGISEQPISTILSTTQGTTATTVSTTDTVTSTKSSISEQSISTTLSTSHETSATTVSPTDAVTSHETTATTICTTDTVTTPHAGTTSHETTATTVSPSDAVTTHETTATTISPTDAVTSHETTATTISTTDAVTTSHETTATTISPSDAVTSHETTATTISPTDAVTTPHETTATTKSTTDAVTTSHETTATTISTIDTVTSTKSSISEQSTSPTLSTSHETTAAPVSTIDTATKSTCTKTCKNKGTLQSGCRCKCREGYTGERCERLIEEVKQGVEIIFAETLASYNAAFESKLFASVASLVTVYCNNNFRSCCSSDQEKKSGTFGFVTTNDIQIAEGYPVENEVQNESTPQFITMVIVKVPSSSDLCENGAATTTNRRRRGVEQRGDRERRADSIYLQQSMLLDVIQDNMKTIATDLNVTVESVRAGEVTPTKSGGSGTSPGAVAAIIIVVLLVVVGITVVVVILIVKRLNNLKNKTADRGSGWADKDGGDQKVPPEEMKENVQGHI